MISAQIKNTFQERLNMFNILVDEIAMTSLSFSKEYEKAIELKQVRQQQAERMKYIVEQAKQKKKSTIIKAEADVEAIRMIGESVASNPAFLELERIEAAKAIAENISKSRNKVLLSSDQLLMNFDLKNKI